MFSNKVNEEGVKEFANIQVGFSDQITLHHIKISGVLTQLAQIGGLAFCLIMLFGSVLTPFARHSFEMEAFQKLYRVRTKEHAGEFEKLDLDERMSTILTTAEQQDIKNLHEYSAMPFCCKNKVQ